MEVIKEAIPVERKTRVELTDKEIALITVALLNDDEEKHPGNADLWAEFVDLQHNLDIAAIS